MNNSKILLVDDDESIQKVLQTVLEKENFKVFTATNGKTAQEILKAEQFKIVITDMNMPGSGGLELLKHIQSNYPELPAILMTGFTKIIDTKTAFEFGAKVFLAKPFHRNELTTAINHACASCIPKKFLNTTEPEPAEEYCRIGIDQFYSGKTVMFELFIRFDDSKYIRVANTGENIDLDRIRAYKNKGVNYLYIKKNDFAKYASFNLALSKAAKSSTMISHEKKFQLARQTSAVIYENLYINGMNQQDFNQAKKITETIVSQYTEAQGGFELLLALSHDGDYLYTHSLGVCLFSVLIAKQLKWDSLSMINKIATAALFHDIGIKEIDPKIVEKPRSLRSYEEIKQLETHPTRSAAILARIPSISDDILQTVLQHHESSDGQGYPSNTPANRIIPMARLISVADRFCELALADANSPGLPAKQVMDRLSLVIVNVFDVQFLNALKTILGLEEYI